MLTIQNENETVRQREILKMKLVQTAVSSYISKTEMPAAEVELLQEFATEAGHVAFAAEEATPPPSFICPKQDIGPYGNALSTQPIVGQGGTPPYSFSLVPNAGTLPVGLHLNSTTGVISGTAITNGDFTIQMTDAKGRKSSNTCKLSVAKPATPPASLSTPVAGVGGTGIPANPEINADAATPTFKNEELKTPAPVPTPAPALASTPIKK